MRKKREGYEKGKSKFIITLNTWKEFALQRFRKLKANLRKEWNNEAMPLCRMDVIEGADDYNPPATVSSRCCRI